MNKDQGTGIAERLLYGVVVYLTAIGVKKGWYDGETAAWLTSGVVSLVGGAYAWFINRPAALAASAATQAKNETVTAIAQLPEVKEIIVDRSKEGVAVAAATPDNVKVAA